jgi:hypothetical protein
MELFSGDALKFFGIDKKIVSAERMELGHISLQRNPVFKPFYSIQG